MILHIFDTYSDADLYTILLTRRSLDQYLASKIIFYPLTISTYQQVWRQTQSGWVFSPMIWCLGRCAYCKVSNSLSKAIQVIELSLCVCTRSPIFLYQDQTLLSLSAARSSSKSSSNIPRCDANEPILFLFLQSFFPDIWIINPREPSQVYSMLLTPLLLFTCLTHQWLEYTIKAISCHIFSNLIGGTVIFL